MMTLEQKHLEALVHQREFFQSVLENAPVGITILDGQTLRIKWINGGNRHYLDSQYWSQDLTGVMFLDLIPHAYESGVAEIFHKAAATGEPYYNPEYELTGFERGITYWRFSLLPLPGKDEGTRDLILIGLEITEQVLTRKRVELLASTAGYLLSSEDPQEFIRSVYLKLRKHLGLDVYLNYLLSDDGHHLLLSSSDGISEELVKKIECLDFIKESYGWITRNACHVVAEEIQQSSGPQQNLQHALGLQAYACQPLLAHGRLIGTLSFGIRLRRQFNDDELALMQAICDQVAIAIERSRLMSELRQRAADFSEADHRKDEFLAMLAHELRNPLATISSAIQLLHLRGGDDPLQNQARNAAERQVKHMARLLDDLLDVARITRGKIELYPEPVELGNLLNMAIQTNTLFLQDKGLKISVVYPPSQIWIEADPNRLQQIFSNLFHNAATYTSRGGQIWVTLTVQDQEAVIQIKDNGMGIAPEILPHIFDLFFQADRSLNRPYGGLGIGLTLVKRLVEMHGGQVHAHSEGPGKGSQFTIRFPLKQLHQEASVMTSTPTESERPALHRILVVEDNEDTAEMMATMLSMEGHKVMVAHTGPTALQHALSYQPDVVLLDIGLPGMNGYEVARQLRQCADIQQPLLIAVTGYGGDTDRQQTRAAGFDYHLVKPVDPQSLRRLLAGEALLPNGKGALH